MSDHTPGPWKVNKYGGIGAGEHGTTTLIIDSGGFNHDWSEAERKRHDADKRLIAAAPDLLLACQAVLHANNNTSGMGTVYEMTRALSEVRAAVAKAKP